MAWADIVVDASVDDTQGRILEGLGDALGEDYEIVDGAPEVALGTEFGTEAYATQLLAVDATRLAAATGFAVGMMGYPPFSANAATLPGVQLALLAPASSGDGVNPVTLPVIIPAGFTVASGDQSFSVPTDLGQLVEFAPVTSGDNAGAYAGTITVTMTALDAGAAGNVPAGTPVTINSTASVAVTGATLTMPGTGGADEETLTAYLTRFTNYVATLKPGGVRASELGSITSTIAGCQRALAVDLYDPADPGVESERTVTVIPVDSAGQPVGPVTKTEVANYLESIREINFIFHVIDPTYTPLDVELAVTAAPGADKVAVQAAVEAAVTALIDPATWGTFAGDRTTWVERVTLSVLDIAGVVNPALIAGVASLGAVTINGGTAEVTLAGPGALPSPLSGGSSVTVTVA